MVYSEELADKIRNLLKNNQDVNEKKMFGSIAFMVNGNMSIGIVKNDLMVRIGKENYDDAINHPFTKPMDFTGKIMKSMIYVDEEGIEDNEYLEYWIDRGIDYAKSIPMKLFE